MRNYFIILFIFFVAGCKSVAKYTIDEKPLIKTDSALLGIWKAVEDTNKADYILIQSAYDIFHYVDWWYNLDSVKKRAYFDESFLADPERVKMAFHKDKTVYDEAHSDFLKKNGYYYYITRMSSNGKNPHYQQWSVFPSKINNVTFLNVPYRHVPGHSMAGQIKQGYFFVRLISATNDELTTVVVSDTALGNLQNSKEVRNHITKNITDPAFYKDTVHFRKVNSYHLSLEESKKIANP